MLQVSLFDLPVYRLKEDKYYLERKVFVDKFLFGKNDERKGFYIQNENLYRRYSAQLNERYGGKWDFNEIIGYIKLHFLGSQVRGEYWEVKAKRIVKTRKKYFEWRTHKLAPERELCRNKTNLEIYNEIIKYIDDCRKELPNKRYIDDKQLISLGPYIDWKKVIKVEV